MNNTVIVLGYREGITTALAHQGYQIIHIGRIRLISAIFQKGGQLL